jgi:hypothetical protein
MALSFVYFAAVIFRKHSAMGGSASGLLGFSVIDWGDSFLFVWDQISLFSLELVFGYSCSFRFCKGIYT